MSERLRDKVALIVGAGSIGPGWGNGKATAVVFAREGARVLCADVKDDAAQETVDIISGHPCALPRRPFMTDTVDKVWIGSCFGVGRF